VLHLGSLWHLPLLLVFSPLLFKSQNKSQPMPEQIVELPAGPIEGGGGRVHPPRPGVEELPAGPVYAFAREAVTELFRLRDRVHALESEL
jgi:hypothetical protein